MEEGLEEGLITVIQEKVSVLDFTGTERRKEAESSRSIGKISHSPPVALPYQPPVPYP